MSYDESSVFKLVQYNIIFRLLIGRSVLGYMSNLKRPFFKFGTTTILSTAKAI